MKGKEKRKKREWMEYEDNGRKTEIKAKEGKIGERSNRKERKYLKDVEEENEGKGRQGKIWERGRMGRTE